MNAIQEREFIERVALLGHDKAAIKHGRECCAYFTLPTVFDARRVLSLATPANRQARQETFFNPGVAARRRLGQGLHDRGEAVLFAAGTIADADREGQSRHLPIHVKGLSVFERTIEAGDVWDLSVRGDAWGLVAVPESTVHGDAMGNLARLVGVRDHPASPEL